MFITIIVLLYSGHVAALTKPSILVILLKRSLTHYNSSLIPTLTSKHDQVSNAHEWHCLLYFLIYSIVTTLHACRPTKHVGKHPIEHTRRYNKLLMHQHQVTLTSSTYSYLPHILFLGLMRLFHSISSLSLTSVSLVHIFITMCTRG